jgi:hypothetical protein
MPTKRSVEFDGVAGEQDSRAAGVVAPLFSVSNCKRAE